LIVDKYHVVKKYVAVTVNMNKAVHPLVLIFLILLACFSPAQAAQPLKVGVSPNGEDSVALARVWIPFLEQVEKQSGIPLRFATAPDLLEFNRRVSQGEYDLIITNKYLYTIFSRKHHLSYIAELCRSNKNNAVALISPTSVTDVQSLQGALVAIRQDEEPAHVRALDGFLNQSGVTATRDSLPSYDKIFESISEELHMGGLVPINQLQKQKYPYHILWQTDNRNLSVLSSPGDANKAEVKRIMASLETLMTEPKQQKAPDMVVDVVAVFSTEHQTPITKN
jgi:phosphonate transport system substrate-binding protein